MQLMPGTAREQAGKLGVAYMSASLNTDRSTTSASATAISSG
jgi:hypothetical protein